MTKKASFLFRHARITVRSNHLPLKRFLEKSTLNSKVNNWAVELKDQNISFEYIPGVSNVLADTLSRLIEIDSTVQLKPEESGKSSVMYHFSNYQPFRLQSLKNV